MVQLQLLIFTLTFTSPIVYLDASTCPKGQRVSRKTQGCEACPDGQYQPVAHQSRECKPCTKCDEGSGSMTKQKCTKESNTECRCQPNFSPIESDSSTCKCPVGFGLSRGQCSQCQHGYYSAKVNSPCQQWKECKSGVAVAGTSSSDVICSDNNNTALPRTTKQKSFTSAPAKSRHPQTNPPQVITFISTTHAAPTAKGEEDPSAENNIGLILSLLGLLGIIFLVFLVAVLWKTKKIRSRKATIQQVEESLCRQPVEESGDDSSSYKRNSEDI